MSDRPVDIDVQKKRGVADSGRYFQYMAEFVGLTAKDVLTIRQTKPIIEKYLAQIVTEFYDHLLRYPPTRKFFLKRDGSLDIDYIEMRMRHLSNFWVRTASAVFDDDYARYIDYVGRAHTSHGADQRIYIAERYVIGQVGFMQRAIHQVLVEELQGKNEELEHRAVEAWDKLMMVLLEMLARAYSSEREEEGFDPLVPVDGAMVAKLATHAYEHEFCEEDFTNTKAVYVARADEIPNGERKIIKVDDLTIGVFHHDGQWYALRNSCLHRGGPVATGEMTGDTLICPWHGYEYNLTTGELLSDPSARIPMYPIAVQNGDVIVLVPDYSDDGHNHDFEAVTPIIQVRPKLDANQFWIQEVPVGSIKKMEIDGESVAVFNLSGAWYATEANCTHRGGDLSEGELDEDTICCPVHGACFRIPSGEVVNGPTQKPLKTYRVVVDGNIGKVMEPGL